jgi:hypothetical protein
MNGAENDEHVHTRNHHAAGFHTGILIERANLAEQKSAAEQKAALLPLF